jgi:acyl carrier protein
MSGELYVSGQGVATGYLNQPQWTTERFVQGLWGEDAARRWYRTGDLVRYNGAGELEYVGRLDEQVKIRGYRVEPAEVSHALEQLPGVRKALVVAERERQRLVGYVELADAAQGDEMRRLREALSAVLPAYQVPSVLVWVEAWPLTANGKVDRRALPAVTVSSETYIAPATQTEHQLVAMVSNLLGLSAEQISVSAGFFELGGHSLLLMRLLTAIKQQFAADISVKSLFECESISQVADLIDNELRLQHSLITVDLASSEEELWEV